MNSVVVPDVLIVRGNAIRAGTMAAVLATALCAVFWDTSVSMMSTWWSSETFSHGLLVLPVFFWLVWRNRVALSECAYSFDRIPLLLCLVPGVVWLLSRVAGIQAGEQLALTAMLILVIWSAIGRRAARLIAFPLAFLLFLAPIGEEFVPQLMEVTAELTTFAIRLTGIPIYREGLYFSLPSGDWSVVEACSGIRYLIASVALGALYAYLTYRSPVRRAGFILLAVIVPIAANGIRAFGIVMIGHFSGMRLATGVDHLIYGWLFFGFVMFVLFSLGALFREPEILPIDSSSCRGTNQGLEHSERLQCYGNFAIKRTSLLRTGNLLAYSALFCVCILVWPAWAAAIDRSKAQGKWINLPELATLSSFGGSTESSHSVSFLTDWRPVFSGHDSVIEATIELSNEVTGKLINIDALAYVYQEQNQGKEMINSMNRLVTSKDPTWRSTSTKTVSVDSARLSDVSQSILRTEDQNLLVWHWYQVGSTHTTNAIVAKLLETRNRLMLKRTQSVAWFLIADDSGPSAQPGLQDAIQKFFFKL